MKTKTYYIIAFAVIALIQAFVPVNMIIHHEEVLTDGNLYKFKCAPVDPNDPFRGKFVALAYEAERHDIAAANFKEGEQVFVLLEKDADGYAKIGTVQSDEFNTGDYFLAKIRGVSEYQLLLEFPFNRYYIEESKAKAAETVYGRTNQEAVAHIYVKKGSAVLKKLMIGNKTIDAAAEEYISTSN